MPKDTQENFKKVFHKAICAGMLLSFILGSIPTTKAQEGAGEEEFPTWILPYTTPDPEPEPESDPEPQDLTSTSDVVYATQFTYTPPETPVHQPNVTITPAYVTDPEPTPEPAPVVEDPPAPIEPTPQPETESEGSDNNFMLPSTPAEPAPEENQAPDNNFVLPSAPKEEAQAPDNNFVIPPATKPEEPKSNIQPSIFGNPQPPTRSENTLNSAPKADSNESNTDTLFSRPAPVTTPTPESEPAPTLENQTTTQTVTQPTPAPKTQTTTKPANTVRVSQYKSGQRQSAGTTTIVFTPKAVFNTNSGTALPYNTEKTHLLGNRNIETQISTFLQSERPTVLYRLGISFFFLLILVVILYLYKKRHKIYREIAYAVHWIKRMIRKEVYKFLHWLLNQHFSDLHHERKHPPVSFTKRRI